MDNAVLVAVISFAGTLTGTLGGILASGKLTAFRLKQLEARLTAQSESVAKIPVIEERLTGLSRRILLLEREGLPYSDKD